MDNHGSKRARRSGSQGHHHRQAAGEQVRGGGRGDQHGDHQRHPTVCSETTIVTAIRISSRYSSRRAGRRRVAARMRVERQHQEFFIEGEDHQQDEPPKMGSAAGRHWSHPGHRRTGSGPGPRCSCARWRSGNPQGEHAGKDDADGGIFFDARTAADGSNAKSADYSREQRPPEQRLARPPPTR
jgi:hypothetical protein